MKPDLRFIIFSVSWAYAYANSIDPIHLTFSSSLPPDNNNDEP